MDKNAMKAKIKAAYNTRTSKTMTEGEFNTIIDICQGIIEEIIASSVVTGQITIPGGSSAGVYTFDAGAKVSS